MFSASGFLINKKHFFFSKRNASWLEAEHNPAVEAKETRKWVNAWREQPGLSAIQAEDNTAVEAKSH